MFVTKGFAIRHVYIVIEEVGEGRGWLECRQGPPAGVMLSAIVKDSQAKQAKIKAYNDRNRKEALAATESVANLMTDGVQESVNEVFVAQNKLEKEVKGLQTNTAHFAKQTYQWLEMIKAFNGSLKVQPEPVVLCMGNAGPP